MTVLTERRRDGDVIAGILAVASGFAAWRGAEGAPVIAAGAGLIAAFIVCAWIRWRCRPPRQLTITAEQITFGRPGHRTTCIPRTAGPLELRRSPVRYSSLWLSAPPRSGVPGIPMLGFDSHRVRQACVSSGWDLSH